MTQNQRFLGTVSTVQNLDGHGPTKSSTEAQRSPLTTFLGLLESSKNGLSTDMRSITCCRKTTSLGVWNTGQQSGNGLYYDADECSLK